MTQDYLADLPKDDIMRVITALATEVYALQDRMSALEAALHSAGIDLSELDAPVEAAVYDEKRLEDMLKRATNEQLNYIKYLGGVLGCIGGLVIWQPIPSLIVLGAIGGVIYGVDVVLFRLRNAE